VEYRLAPPTLGQHTDEVLGSLLGRTAGQLADYREVGII
jgi:hypothetical protein